MKIKLGLFVLFVISAMLLTACTISITTKVNPDGSGEMGVTFKFTEEEINMMGTGTPSADLCNSMQSSDMGMGMPEDMVFKQEEHDKEIWCVATKSFANLNELSGGDESFKINTAEISGEKFTFDADINMGAGEDTSGITFPIEMYYELTAPGTIDKAKTNTDTIKGNTATWTLEMGKSKTVHLESSTKGGGGGSSITDKKVGGVPVWAIVVAVCCCLLLLVIVVVVVFFFMRRKPKTGM